MLSLLLVFFVTDAEAACTYGSYATGHGGVICKCNLSQGCPDTIAFMQWAASEGGWDCDINWAGDRTEVYCSPF